MKKMIISLALLLFMVKLFGQTAVLSKDHYLKKSKIQKTVGWVMLGGGVAMTTIGLVLITKQVNDDPLNLLEYSEGYGILTLAGAGTALGSIPFFISSAKNKRRALSLAISNQKIFVPQPKGYALNSQPTLTLKLAL